MAIWKREHFEIDTDLDRLDFSVIHDFLRNAYWSQGVPREIVERSCHASACFGLYDVQSAAGSPLGPLVGFARAITDYTTFGYLADVFVLESHRGIGLSKWLVGCVIDDPRFAGLKRWLLATRDAHTLYTRFGFEPLSDASKFMEIARPGQLSRAPRG